MSVLSILLSCRLHFALAPLLACVYTNGTPVLIDPYPKPGRTLTLMMLLRQYRQISLQPPTHTLQVKGKGKQAMVFTFQSRSRTCSNVSLFCLLAFSIRVFSYFMGCRNFLILRLFPSAANTTAPPLLLLKMMSSHFSVADSDLL